MVRGLARSGDTCSAIMPLLGVDRKNGVVPTIRSGYGAVRFSASGVGGGGNMGKCGGEVDGQIWCA